MFEEERRLVVRLEVPGMDNDESTSSCWTTRSW
jgi:hypothetical protein